MWYAASGWERVGEFARIELAINLPSHTQKGFQASSLPYLPKVASMGLPFGDYLCPCHVRAMSVPCPCHVRARQLFARLLLELGLVVHLHHPLLAL